MKEKYKEILSFYKRYVELEQTLRNVFVEKNIPAERMESLGDHTLQLIMLVSLFHKKLGLPISEKLIDMLLINELSKVAIDNASSIDIARRGVIDVLSDFDEATRNYFLLLWEEFKKGVSDTAKYAIQIDKIDTLFKAKYYEEEYDLDGLFEDIFNYERRRAIFSTGPLAELAGTMDPGTLDQVNSIRSFEREHTNAIVVNYDLKYVGEYGVAYYTNDGKLERFIKVGGEFITYPVIQPYQTGEYAHYELFIIHDHRLYEVARILEGNPKSNYRIIREIKCNDQLYQDPAFMEYKKAVDSQVTPDNLLSIKEINK